MKVGASIYQTPDLKKNLGWGGFPGNQKKTLDTPLVSAIRCAQLPIVFMVLGVSYLRVLAQRPTGCCSASFLTSLYQYLNTYKQITAKSQSLVILTLIYLKLMIMLYFVTILTQFYPRVSSEKLHCQPDSQIGAVP